MVETLGLAAGQAHAPFGHFTDDEEPSVCGGSGRASHAGGASASLANGAFGSTPSVKRESARPKRMNYRASDWMLKNEQLPTKGNAFASSAQTVKVFTPLMGFMHVLEHNAQVGYDEQKAKETGVYKKGAWKDDPDYFFKTDDGLQAKLMQKLLNKFLLNRRRYSQIPLARGHRDQVLRQIESSLSGSLRVEFVDAKTTRARNHSVMTYGEDAYADSKKAFAVAGKPITTPQKKLEEEADFSREWMEADRADEPGNFTPD